ncbi:hypothetical protein IWX49DRAFT_109643 [Phyllosticta citricarpa]
MDSIGRRHPAGAGNLQQDYQRHVIWNHPVRWLRLADLGRPLRENAMHGARKHGVGRSGPDRSHNPRRAAFPRQALLLSHGPDNRLEAPRLPDPRVFSRKSNSRKPSQDWLRRRDHHLAIHCFGTDHLLVGEVHARHLDACLHEYPLSSAFVAMAGGGRELPRRSQEGDNDSSFGSLMGNDDFNPGLVVALLQWASIQNVISQFAQVFRKGLRLIRSNWVLAGPILVAAKQFGTDSYAPPGSFIEEFLLAFIHLFLYFFLSDAWRLVFVFLLLPALSSLRFIWWFSPMTSR